MKLSLQEGELFCPKCDGKGFIKGDICTYCSGMKTILWIDHAVGRGIENFKSYNPQVTKIVNEYLREKREKKV